jgi:hypothetical protein
VAAVQFKKRAKPMDIHTRLGRHRDLTEQIRTMIARCTELREAGHLEEARRLLMRIERLTEELNQLEK